LTLPDQSLQVEYFLDGLNFNFYDWETEADCLLKINKNYHVSFHTLSVFDVGENVSLLLRLDPEGGGIMNGSIIAPCMLLKGTKDIVLIDQATVEFKDLISVRLTSFRYETMLIEGSRFENFDQLYNEILKYAQKDKVPSYFPEMMRRYSARRRTT